VDFPRVAQNPLQSSLDHLVQEVSLAQSTRSPFDSLRSTRVRKHEEALVELEPRSLLLAPPPTAAASSRRYLQTRRRAAAGPNRLYASPPPVRTSAPPSPVPSLLHAPPASADPASSTPAGDMALSPVCPSSPAGDPLGDMR
jgi:hypothetical protein